MERFIYRNFTYLEDPMLEKILVWRNCAHQSKVEVITHLNFVHALRTRDDCVYWLVCFKGTFLGVVAIKNIMMRDGEYDFYLRPGLKGKGLEAILVRALLHMCFNIMNLDNIYKFVDDRDGPKIALLLRFGFSYRESPAAPHVAIMDMWRSDYLQAS